MSWRDAFNCKSHSVMKNFKIKALDVWQTKNRGALVVYFWACFHNLPEIRIRAVRKKPLRAVNTPDPKQSEHYLYAILRQIENTATKIYVRNSQFAERRIFQFSFEQSVIQFSKNTSVIGKWTQLILRWS